MLGVLEDPLSRLRLFLVHALPPELEGGALLVVHGHIVVGLVFALALVGVVVHRLLLPTALVPFPCPRTRLAAGQAGCGAFPALNAFSVTLVLSATRRDAMRMLLKATMDSERASHAI